MTKPITQTDLMEWLREHASELNDRLMFDDEASAIDKLGRSARREAIKTRGYPRARRVGLRSAWLYSEILAWVRAQPPVGELPKTPPKALCKGVKRMRAKHAQHVAEAGAGEVAP
jgi:predicted DNA-binding transcriptional regulator AlpA